MNPSFRQRLKARELLVGTLISLASPEVTEIMAAPDLTGCFWTPNTAR